MRIIFLFVLLLLPFRFLGQDTSGHPECDRQYTYSADHNRFYYITRNCDSILICDFNICAYYWYFPSYFFLTKAEQEYEGRYGNSRYIAEYGYYQDSVVEELYKRCPVHKFVVRNGNFTTIIEGDQHNLQTGVYRKYFKDTLVAKGRFANGQPTGFCTFYDYSLHHGKAIFYFIGNEHGHSYDFMDYAISLTAIVLGLLVIALCAIVIYKGWYVNYTRYHIGIFYTLLTINGLINVCLGAAENRTGASNPFLLLFLLKMVNRGNVALALLGYFLLISSAIYLFLPGNRANIRVAAIIILIYNLLIFLIHNALAHSHFAFG